MRFRQLVGLVLVVGLLTVAFPAPSEAGVLGCGTVGDLVEPGIFARMVEWAQGLWDGLGEWLTAEGSTPTSNG